MTNATKAVIGAAINSTLSLAVLAHLLSDVVAGSLGVALNAWLAVFVLLTYKDSAKRVPD
jgi:hypothetical protein